MTRPNSTSRRRFLQGSALVAGAAMSSCMNMPGPGSIAAPGRSRAFDLYPRHNDRTRGWLRFLWEKATTADDWSYREGEELPWGIRLPRGALDFNDDGVGPHPWWDQYSLPPYLSYPRFDLSDSSYGVLLMADQTPAWREVYTRIMDELATRHTAWWAAIDWNTFIGPSPDRGNYPEAMMQGWPERVRGDYDFPGWTANGVQPWGLQPDPIGADGNLFFRGWLNLVLTIYKHVSGDDKWERPWSIAGYENEQFEWTQPRIVEHLHRQYTERPEGPHCENTKVWPYCNSAAGLGIYLSDQLGVTPNAHGVFADWIGFAQDNYMGFDARGNLEWITNYYDPIENFTINGPAEAGPGIAFYLMPQAPEIATRLYDHAANTLGWRDPRRAIQPSSSGLTLARVVGDHTAVARLSAAAEREYEPRWFGANGEQFGWWFNLNEPWPRGQRSAQMMINEIDPGNWAEAFSVKHPDKFAAPVVEGIDFPGLGVDQAWNDKASGVLHVGTYAADPGRRGEATSWRVTGLPDAGEVFVLADGSPMQNLEVLNPGTIRIHSDIGSHQFQIYTGYRGEQTARRHDEPTVDIADAGTSSARRRSAEENIRAAESALLGGATACPCCASSA